MLKENHRRHHLGKNGILLPFLGPGGKQVLAAFGSVIVDDAKWGPRNDSQPVIPETVIKPFFSLSTSVFRTIAILDNCCFTEKSPPDSGRNRKEPFSSLAMVC